MGSKWTNKLMSKASKLTKKETSDNGNVDDFLYGSGGAPPPRASLTLPTTTAAEVAAATMSAQYVGPKLDLDDNDNGLGEPLPPENPRYALKPVRRKPGLKVGFTDDKPALIGEGGDEATLPTMELMQHTTSIRPIQQSSSGPAITLESNQGERSRISDLSGLLGRSATKKPTGPGWLQKRRSFNMEEGKIQRENSGFNTTVVAERSGYGASLDPSSAQQTLPLPDAPPPPSEQMDGLKHRQKSLLPGLLRAAAGDIRRESRDRSRSPAEKKWDDLLAHPAIRTQSQSPASDSPPSQLIDMAHIPTASQIPTEAPTSQPASSDPHVRKPVENHNGAFPSRPPMPPQHSQPADPPPVTQPSSPANSTGSINTPLSDRIERLMGSIQQMPPNHYQRNSKDGTSSSTAPRGQPNTMTNLPQTNPQAQAIQFALNGPNFLQEPQLPILRSTEDGAQILDGGQRLSKELHLPIQQQGTGSSSLSDPQNEDHRQPTLPDLSAPTNPPSVSEVGSNARDWRQLDLFPEKPDIAPVKGPLTHTGPLRTDQSLAARGPPPLPVHQSPGSHHTSKANFVHSHGENRPDLYEMGNPSPRFPPPSPGRSPVSPKQFPHASNSSRDDLSRRSSQDVVLGSTNNLSSSQDLFVPQKSERSAPTDSRVDLYGTSRSDSNQHPVPHSPGQAPIIPQRPYEREVQSSEQVSSPAASTAPPMNTDDPSVKNNNMAYRPARASTTDDFQFCVDALRPAFTEAETLAKAVIRPKAGLWLRIASWWNLKGRKAFESKIKEQVQRGGPQSAHVDETLLQPFVDASKAWWITERILPSMLQNSYPGSPAERGELDVRTLQQVYQTLRVQIETFISSVTRRRLLPAPALLRHDLDTMFLVEYPTLPGALRTITTAYGPSFASEQSQEAGFFPVVLADDQRHFSFGHLFAEAQVDLPEDDDEEDLVLPCVISLIRERSKSHMEMAITSQDGQIDVRVRADRGLGPSWKDVDMRTRSHSLRIQLVSDTALIVRLEKEDFKTLWGMREYNKRVMDTWMPMKEERIIFAAQLHDLNYQQPQGQPCPLPTNPTKFCSLRLYERTDLQSLQENGRSIFNGHRIVIMTQPEVKSLSSVNQVFTANAPVLHNYLRGGEQKPALMIHFLERGLPASMIPAFMSDDDRMRFIDKLAGSYIAGDEEIIETIPIHSVTVSTSVPGTPANLLEIPGIEWQDISIIGKTEETGLIESGRFRIASHCTMGSLVDRPVVQPGEIKIGLDTLDLNFIRLRRSMQSSLILALMENALPAGLAQPLQEAFDKKSTAPSTVRYKFNKPEDLHRFQRLVTGYEVVYDAMCSLFSIKGQRTTGGVHKRLEATKARLQLVKDQSGLQLLAFFKDMPEGACMSFSVTSTDVLELSVANHKHCIKFVDARFGVPKALSEPDATFVSLDLPEFAGERDDIVVGFDKETERDQFSQALPATPTKAHGLSSFKRFVDLGRPGSRSSTHQ